MTRLAVMAAFDPTGGLGPQVRRQVEALTEAYDDVVVVSTSDLRESSREWLGARVRLIERANEGYDFFSYRAGLEAAGDLSRYDAVTVCNDTYVGPLRSYSRLHAEMEARPGDFWGLTESDRIAHHVQSFFVTFRPSAVQSEAFATFWSTMVPISKRWKVIRAYEIGMSQRLYEAGLTSSSYFEESDRDRTVGRRRVRWWAWHRGALRTRADLRRLREQRAEPWNPAIGLADRALDDGRLPYVKIDTLRYDPYGLGADRLLTWCEERFGEEFDGVRAFLASTAAHYPRRPGEELRRTPLPARPLQPFVRYRADGR